MGERKVHTGFLWGNLREQATWKDLGRAGITIIIEPLLSKYYLGGGGGGAMDFPNSR
jgi:hypothetical protein